MLERVAREKAEAKLEAEKEERQRLAILRKQEKERKKEKVVTEPVQEEAKVPQSDEKPGKKTKETKVSAPLVQ